VSARSLDSRFVDTYLRRILWPELKAIGFRRSGRTAWRDRPHAVQVVCIQSFNSYVAEGVGATTSSFTVPIGVFYPVIAEYDPVPSFHGDPARPAEWQCHARNHLGKGISQEGEWFPSPLADRPDVWFVSPDGSNVEAVVTDARDRILFVGLPWLERLADVREARRAFAEDAGTSVAFGLGGEDYGGSLESPVRFYSIEALSTLIDDPSRHDGHRG
jgi:Domain of unknown function (DUF4304)